MSHKKVFQFLTFVTLLHVSIVYTAHELKGAIVEVRSVWRSLMNQPDDDRSEPSHAPDRGEPYGGHRNNWQPYAPQSPDPRGLI